MTILKRTNSAFLSVSEPKKLFGDGFVRFEILANLEPCSLSEARERACSVLGGANKHDWK